MVIYKTMRFVHVSFELLFSLIMIAFCNSNFVLATNEPRRFALLPEIPAHSEDIYTLVFSPDGTILVSAGEDGSIALWDTDTWKLVRRLEGSSGAVRALTFSPDGSALAAGADDGTVRLWNTKTWAEPKVVPAHSRDIRAAVFSEDGKQLITSGRDVKVQPAGRFGRVRSFVSIDRTDDTVKLWNTSGWTLTRTLLQSNSRVIALEFSPAGRLLASGAEDGQINLFDTKNWQTLKRLDYESSSLKALTFAEGGTQLIGGGHRRGLTVWSTPNWSEVVMFDSPASPIQAIDYNVLENRLVVGGRNRVPTFLRSNGTEIIETVQEELKSDKSISAIRFSPDGLTLAFGSNDGIVSIAQPALPIPMPTAAVTPLVSVTLPLVAASLEKPSSDSFLEKVSTFIVGLLIIFGLFVVIQLPRAFRGLNKELQHQKTSSMSGTAMIKKQTFTTAPTHYHKTLREHEAASENQGYVYLLRSGDYYKIGKSRDYNKRIKAIKLQLPFEVEKVHVVKAKDMNQLERYWHQRFKNKRENGEWFVLSAEDIREFKKQ